MSAAAAAAAKVSPLPRQRGCRSVRLKADGSVVKRVGDYTSDYLLAQYSVIQHAGLLI
jgi:hypothetical protein